MDLCLSENALELEIYCANFAHYSTELFLSSPPSTPNTLTGMPIVQQLDVYLFLFGIRSNLSSIRTSVEVPTSLAYRKRITK